MAKKSARSKGYRKSTGKKPYLSKRDIIVLCLLLAAVAVGAILLFSYDDGGLKTRDGKVVDAGENWLIVNGAASGGRRYYKVGEAGDMEGFVREATPMLSDENLTTFKYIPDDDDTPLRSVTMSASAGTAQRVSEYYHNLLASSLTVSDPATATADAGEYSYFTYTNEYYAEDDDAETADDADAEQPDAEPAEETADEAAGETADAEPDSEEAPAPNHFEQGINAYIDAKAHGSVAITCVFDVASADSYLSEDELKAFVEQAIAAVQFTEK